MKLGLRPGFVLAILLGLLTACSRPQKVISNSWNPKTAAGYLDQREITWMGWPGSARDHGTFCVSCHTAVPYALSRPVLRAALAETGPSINERRLLENVTKRVRLWNQVEPFYTDGGKYHDGKGDQSRGTESVLNALILASNDAQNGRLDPTTRMAFNDMWALQQTTGEGNGSWPWLQFGMEPWEAQDSRYYGAALAAIAIGIAPEDYRQSTEIQAQLRMLRDYLNRESSRQSTVNRVVLLWASSKLPGLLDSAGRETIIKEVREAQQSDGGWRLSSLAWPNSETLHAFARRRLRADWTLQEASSDGFATGLITFALQQAGLSPADSTVQRGVTWLTENQSRDDGSWPSSSINQRRNSSSNVGHFMRDAATAYAVLALSQSGDLSRQSSSMAKNRSGKDRFAALSSKVGNATLAH